MTFEEKNGARNSNIKMVFVRNMYFSSVCRLCLSEASLSPIFTDSDQKATFSNNIYLSTGIKVYPNDGLPQSKCHNCEDFIIKSLKYRIIVENVQNKLISLRDNNQYISSKKTLPSVHENMELCSAIIDDCMKTELTVKTEIKTEFEETKEEYIDFDILDKYDGEEKPLQDFALNKKETFTETEELPYIPAAYTNDNCKLLRVTCRLCYKQLSIRSVDTHMARSHPGADVRKIKCELCDRYLTKQKMKRHMKMIHSHNGTYVCVYCKNDFSQKEDLIQHIPICSNKKRKRNPCTADRKLIECDICSKKMQKASLRVHKAIKHAGLGPVCEHCGRRFSNKFRLDEHYRAKHGYGKFKCSYCQFESASTLGLQNHERRHRGEKPFVCDSCPASFHAAYLLNQHRHSHRTERLVKCDQCPASFKATNNLYLHKRGVHGAKRKKKNK